MPPEVDPAQAPVNMRITSSICPKTGHWAKSAVAKPVVVTVDTALKTESFSARPSGTLCCTMRLAAIRPMDPSVSRVYSRSSSLCSAARMCPRREMKIKEKLMPDRNMKMATIHVMAGEPKAAMLALRVEKPPVEMVAKEWTTAS